VNRRSIPNAIALPVAVAGCLLLAACGGSDGATPAAATAASTAVSASADTIAGSTDPATAPADTAAVTPPAETAPAAPAPDGESFDICATIPSLEVINTVLDQPATRVTDLERGPGTDLCEAGGDEIANVQFSRSTTGTREDAVAIATGLGATVVELTDPTLPGAITFAGAVLIYLDGVEYSTQVITLDSITDPGSPAAVERSSILLKAWLTNLGVA
jgi:hypothetical protein